MPDLFLELRDESNGDDQTPAPLPEEEALKLLRSSEITASRLIPWGSNYSFAVALETDDGRTQLAIYKPKAGEAPLYDFPEGTLYRRELAAYLFSSWAGWDLVPPTVIRNGPQGIGSVHSTCNQKVSDPIARSSGAASTSTWSVSCCSITWSTT